MDFASMDCFRNQPPCFHTTDGGILSDCRSYVPNCYLPWINGIRSGSGRTPEKELLESATRSGVGESEERYFITSKRNYRTTTQTLDMHSKGQSMQEKETMLTAKRSYRKKSEEGSVSSFLVSLKECAVQKDLNQGKKIHADIVKGGILKDNVYINTALINMYAKCGALPEASEVFNKLSFQTVAAWNALIAGYAQHGHGDEAIDLFQQMENNGIPPNAITFVCVLKACSSMGAAAKGQEVHHGIMEEGWLEKDILVGNALVDMYAKCGLLENAQNVFDELPRRDRVSWNVLISGYAQQGLGEKALECFKSMEKDGFFADAITYMCILKACGNIGAFSKGQEIHAEIVKDKFLQGNVRLHGALLDMYMKCRAISQAQKLFDDFPLRSIVAFNTLIAGYTEQGHGVEALVYFERMLCEGICPNAVTFVCVLKACGTMGAVNKGQEVHNLIVQTGLLGKNILVDTALMDMYVKCNMITRAKQVFDELVTRDVVLWSTLISGYVQHGCTDEAFYCFKKMQQEGICPNDVTFSCIFKACGSAAAIDKGHEIHARVVKKPFLKANTTAINALIDMYAKCGELVEAQRVFDEVEVRDVTLWTALIAGYVQHGYNDEALTCYEQMQNEGISPNVATFVCILKAYGGIGAIEKGREIHAESIMLQQSENDIMIGTTVLDMYARCGDLVKAQNIFDNLPVYDVISWTVLIAGYAQLGKHDIVFNLLNKMIVEGTEPNVVTFSHVLNVCSHAGLLDQAQAYFQAMEETYNVTPTSEHYICLVDLFCRAGLFIKAVEVIDRMPFPANRTVWHTLLGACQNYGETAFGRFAFEHAIGLDENDAVAYVCMSNIYAAAEIFKNVQKDHLLNEPCITNETQDIYSFSIGNYNSSTARCDDLGMVNLVFHSLFFPCLKLVKY